MEKHRELHLKYTSYLTAVLIYLCLPVLVLLVGTLKPYIGFPVALLWLFFTMKIINDTRGSSNYPSQINISYTHLILCFVFFLFISVLVGIGEFGWSDGDHKIRYAILNDLVNYDWPIIYDFNHQTNPAVREFLGEGSSALVYYYTFWMIPSIIGKLFGLLAARISLVIWSSLGLVLFYLGLGFINNKIQKRSLLLMIFFGGIDLVAFMVKSFMGVDVLLELWNEPYIIHGNFAQLMNVFNQSIPCWLIGEIVYMSTSKKALGFWGALMFFYSPWATIGFFPLVICRLLYSTTERHFRLSELRKLLEIYNLLPPVVALLIMGSFYLSTSNSMSIRGFIWDVKAETPNLLLGYILYLIVEFGIWFALLYKKFHKSPFYWVMMIELMILPLYVVSEVNDFLMRGSTVPMIYVCIMVIESVSDIRIKNIREISRIQLYTLLMLFVLSLSGLIQTMGIVSLTLSGDRGSVGDIISFGDIKNEDEAEIVYRNYYSIDYKNKFFFKYLAK